MSTRLQFSPPADVVTQNDRLHYMAKARRVKAWRTTARFAAMEQLGPARRDRHQPPCFVRVTFPVTTNRRRDSDGPAPTVKAIVDGLVDAFCWDDDTPEFVETLGSRFDKASELVVVELIPMTEGIS